MRGMENLGTAGEASGKARTGRKPMETFVPWKKVTPSATAGRPPLLQSHGVSGKGRGKGMLPSSARATPASSSFPRPRQLLAGEVGGMGLSASVGRQRRQSKASESEGETCNPKAKERLRGEAYGEGLASRIADKELSRQTEVMSKIQPHSQSRTSSPSIFNRNGDQRFACLRGVRQTDSSQNAENRNEESEKWARPGRTQSSLPFRPHVQHEDGEEFGASRAVEDKEKENVGTNDEEEEEDMVHNNDQDRNLQMEVVGLYGREVQAQGKPQMNSNDEDEDNDYQSVHEDKDDDDGGKDRDMQYLFSQTQLERKKERRKERAWREREGDKRRKEGLPRNFLLVDEYTRKPYGVGVGDWRKELMLLSKNLDPAIGNINKQPEEAISEIAEWIKHTWEYSHPIKYEYVKEVIARGVTLRRVELWKKIRNGEPKPKGFSDRTWRTLERQLENPASIRKSENCRKANACRVNFGRTGPSGEVGIRQRLKRILRRSPDPEEMRFEMARDKGYGGRHEKKEVDLEIMHGKQSGRDGIEQKARICGPKLISNHSDSVQNMEEEAAEYISAESDEDDVNKYPVARRRNDVFHERVSSLSEEHISEHPFVQKMMARLTALEEKQKSAVLEEEQELSKEVSIAQERRLGTRGDNSDNEVQNAACMRDRESDESEGKKMSSKRRKRIKRG